MQRNKNFDETAKRIAERFAPQLGRFAPVACYDQLSPQCQGPSVTDSLLCIADYRVTVKIQKATKLQSTFWTIVLFLGQG